jgi:hypothetical protein
MTTTVLGMPTHSNAQQSPHPPTHPAVTPCGDRPAGGGDPVVVRGNDDLVAVVPHLVGFPPEHSLVLVSVRRQGRRSRLGLVARFDLPRSGARARRGTTGTDDLVGQAVEVMRRDEPDEVLALVYDLGPCSVAPPWRVLVEQLDDAFGAAGIPVLDALFVAGRRFRSYRCADVECCPDGGREVDPASSAVAVELVARGSAPLRSRRELHDLVRAADRARCASVESAARRELTAIGACWADDRRGRWRSWQLDSLTVLQDVVERCLGGGRRPDTEEAGRVVAALCDTTVRDAAAELHTSWAAGQDGNRTPDETAPVTASSAASTDGPLGEGGAAGPAGASRLVNALRSARPAVPEGVVGPERARCLDGLWLDLATSCDGPLALAPLTLLGMHVWSQGNGALALAAVQRALTIDPDYRLAGLLDQALELGIRPPGVEPPAEATRRPSHDARSCD